MSGENRWKGHLYEGLITALAVGGVFIIIGLVVILTPGLLGASEGFFSDISTVPYTVGSSTFNLPAPTNPAAHTLFLTAFMNFLLGVGILQIVILALRLGVHSPIRRISETVGNLVFWLGAAVTAFVFLLAGTVAGWFQFWASLIILIGVSLIARFGIHFATRKAQ